MLRCATLGLLAIGLISFGAARINGAETKEDAADKQVLDEWQSHHTTVIHCSFTRWDYDRNLGLKEKDYLVREATGKLEFSDHKHWAYCEYTLKKFDPRANAWLDAADERTSWTCDGKTLCERNYRTKTLHERTIPQIDEPAGWFAATILFWTSGEWQQWITDAKFVREHAEVKIVTPDKAMDEHWLEITPMEPRVKATFERLELILDTRDNRRKAVQVYWPGGKSRTVYVFSPLDHLTESGCQFPAIPLEGWKRIVD